MLESNRITPAQINTMGQNTERSGEGALLGGQQVRAWAPAWVAGRDAAWEAVRAREAMQAMARTLPRLRMVLARPCHLWAI